MTDPLQIAETLAERFVTRADRYDRDAAFPEEDVADLRSAGLLGLLVPERLGGMGAGFEDYVRVAVALARGSGSTALVFNMHAVTGAIAGVPDEIARQLGVPEEYFATRDEMLSAAAAGALYGVAISEREAGSRLWALRSTYEPEGDGYRLRGEKSACTGAGYLDRYLVAARAAHADDDEPCVSYFLIPDLGLRVRKTWDHLGMRATASNSFAMDVHVSHDTLIGGIEGLAILLAYAMPQWLVASYAAVYVGVAQAAVAEAAARVVASPAPGGLAKVGFIRGRLGRADAQAEAAALALYKAGRLVDERPGEPETNRWIYRAKLLAGDAAMEVAATCTEACGLGALRRGSTLERLFRDARCGALMPPSSDVSADVLGSMLLGLDPITGSDIRPW